MLKTENILCSSDSIFQLKMVNVSICVLYLWYEILEEKKNTT